MLKRLILLQINMIFSIFYLCSILIKKAFRIPLAFFRSRQYRHISAFSGKLRRGCYLQQIWLPPSLCDQKQYIFVNRPKSVLSVSWYNGCFIKRAFARNAKIFARQQTSRYLRGRSRQWMNGQYGRLFQHQNGGPKSFSFCCCFFFFM